MTIARILAAIDGRRDSAAVAAASIELGRRFDAQVEWLALLPSPTRMVPASVDAMGGAMTGSLVEVEEETFGERQAEVERLIAIHGQAQDFPIFQGDEEPDQPGFSLKIHSEAGFSEDQFGAAGRLSDLIVVPMSAHQSRGVTTTLLEGAILESGRPVLALPENSASWPGRAIGIAWDGSREAARALSAALPLLKAADKIVILTALVPGQEALPSQVSRYLAAHDLEARTWGFIPRDGRLGDQILEQAEIAGLDLLVMGAYSHSRMAELVLGGVTRRILQKAQLAVLLTH